MVEVRGNPPRADYCRRRQGGMQKAAEPDQRQRWLEQNRDAIDQYNARIEREGLTLARYRGF